MSTILENDQDFALDLPKYTVVSASAGSGKTTALKQRFVQLLLSKSIPWNGLKNILAITFTNNAAREMKKRVLDALKLASLGKPETLTEFGQFLSLRPAELTLQATWLIDEILDNYSDFQIQTIDSFLSRVFKASALELGLSPDLEIVLDSAAILDDAFAIFARELRDGTTSTRLVNDLVPLLLESRAADDRFLWNPYSDLSTKVKDLYRRVLLTSKQLRREDYSVEIRERSDRIIQQIQALDAFISKPGLVKSKRFEEYVKSARGREISRLLDRQFPPPVTKTGSTPSVYQQTVKESEPLCEEIEQLRLQLILLRARQHYQPYAEALTLFSGSIEAVKREQGRVDIGDVAKKLADYLRPGRVPEIYYGLSENLRHFLIDEFQDTSPIQWENLEPLIRDALSKEASLFVVGDTKQSIYGFRGADWRIMKHLLEADVFPSAKKDLRFLKTNFRSFEKILDFDKAVFKNIVPTKVIKGAESSSGLSTDDALPKPEFRNRGYVELTVIPPDAEPDNSGQPSQKQKLVDIVTDCLARGYRKSDITILSPRNNDIIEVSGWLNERHLPFISHSSLDVRSRKITGELLALLQFLESPIDDLAFASFLLGDIVQHLLNQGNSRVGRKELLDFLFSHRIDHRHGHPLYVGFRKTFPELWQKHFEETFNVVGYLPVYDLLSEIYKTLNLFALFPDEEATLVKILEVVNHFEDKGENSLKGFLQYAEDSSDDADWNIDIPTNIDAIKVMTVHKAKGLESKVVIVLLYDARRRSDSLYFQEDGDELRLVRLTKKAAGEIPDLAGFYEKKEIGEAVDELNKLYVALTRAEEEMYVISVQSDYAKAPSELLPEHGYGATQKPAVERRAPKTETSVGLYHTPPHTPVRLVEYTGIALRETRRGDFFHAVLQSITYLDTEIDKQFDEAIRLARLVAPFEVSASELREVFRAALRIPAVEQYFVRKEGRVVLNEQEFTAPDGSLVRMDRIIVDTDLVTVIDYKTGDEKPGYTEQITKYMSILRDFYPGRTVQGLLLYIDRKLIRAIS
ncbi:MAG: UvrD-helicase domain-containing protein [Ignavibacteriales bacterium]|nr:UvrD-helicase domain-containing protein [Ignavibacteriales bacterium]